MKQKFLYLAVAALAMTACSQDETLDINQGKGIGFRTSADKITRATETTTANIENFYVSAFDANGSTYFADQLFRKDDNSFFVSNPLYYWPATGNLTFHAYAPSATDIGGTLSFSFDGDNKLTGFTPKVQIADQVDLIYATATGNRTNNEASGVNLTFDHMLSQVSIKAKNTNSGYVYKVKGVRIGKPVSKGDLAFGKLTGDEEAWTPGQDKANYAVTYDTEITLNEIATSLMTTEGGNAMLIPQQLIAWDPDNDSENTNEGAYLSVLVQITTKDGAQVYPASQEYGWAAVGINTKWQMGKHYVYTLDFSKGAGNVDPEGPDPENPDPDDPFEPGDPILGGQIMFTVTVNVWVNSEQEIEVK